MADSTLILPGNFEVGKNYLIKGEDMLAWRAALLKDRVLPGANLLETQGPKGRIFTAQAGGASPAPVPFQLTAWDDGTSYKYRVSSTASSITDGTNGDSLAITDIDTDLDISVTKFVVMEASVDEDLTLGNFSVALADDAEEVVLDALTSSTQESIRILVGKVTISGDPETIEAAQGLFSCVRVVHGMMNGLGVRVADMAPSHPDIL